MSPEEQRLFRLYGKLPNRNDLLQNKLKVCIFKESTCCAHYKADTSCDRNASTSIAVITLSPKLVKPLMPA